jgi:hypothetical protein
MMDPDSVFGVCESLTVRQAASSLVGFGRKPALYPGRAESRLFDMALKLSKMV